MLCCNPNDAAEIAKAVLEDEASRGVMEIVLAYKSWRRDAAARSANEVRRAANE